MTTPPLDIADVFFDSTVPEAIRVDLPSDTQLEAAEYALNIFLQTGKKRVAIDCRTEQGRILLKRLAGESNIVISDCPSALLDELDWQSFPGDMRASITLKHPLAWPIRKSPRRSR